MAGSEAAQKPSAGSYSVSPFVKKEVHDQIANRSAKARVSWNWYDTWHEEHHRAFVVAKLCKADLLQEVHDSLQKAIDEGQTFEEWRKEIQPKLEGRWLGKTEGELWDEMEEEDKKRLKEQAKEEGRPDPEPTGKQRDKEITPKRLETIYRTNMKVAHVAGQYQSLIDKAELYPYWQYHTQEDDRVRGSHAVLNNKVFRYDDPFWDTHFPPNGWRCRCYVLSLNERGLKRQGLSTDDVIDSSKLKTREDESAGGHTKLTYIIDGKDASTADGWNYNPGKIQNIDSVAKDKIDGYDPELGKQVEGDIKEEAQPKPTAPKQPSAVPSQDKKRPEPAKKPTPKPAAPKPAVSTERPKAEDKPKAQPAVSQPKPSDKPAVKPVVAPKPKPATAEPRPAAAPKPSTAPKPAPTSAVSKPVQQAPAPAKPTVKSTTETQPQQRSQQTAVIKDVIAPNKNQITAPIKPLEPSAPRVIEPIKPADPSIPRAIKPSKSGDPSIPRVAETVKPAELPKLETKQSILQTISNKVSRAVNRVLGWLGVSSKWSSFEELANGDKQNTRYIDSQAKEAKPTTANYTTEAQSQLEENKELALLAAQQRTEKAVGQEESAVFKFGQKLPKSIQALGKQSASSRIEQLSKPSIVAKDNSIPNQSSNKNATKQNANQGDSTVRDSSKHKAFNYSNNDKFNYSNSLSVQQKQSTAIPEKLLRSTIDQYERIVNIASSINRNTPSISTLNAVHFIDHITRPQPTTHNKEGIKGAHLDSTFFSELTKRNGALTSPLAKHPRMPGIKLARYHMIKKDKAGNLTSSYSSKTLRKTIFDDHFCTLEEYTQRAYEAVLNWSSKNTAPLPREFTSFDNSGVLWQCYVNNDILVNAFPDYSGF